MLNCLRQLTFVIAVLTATQASGATEIEGHSCALLMSAVLIHDNDYGSTQFPTDVALAFSRPKLEKFFRLNERLWTLNLDHDRLLRVVRNISGGMHVTAEDAIEYRGDRARLKQLRFAFGLFDIAHVYPDYVDNITTLMGQVQDALSNNQTVIVAQKSAELIELLRGDNWLNLDRELRSFKPAHSRSFTAYVGAQIGELKDSMKKRKVTGKEFHEMRKVISRLLAFFDTVNTLEPGRANQSAVEYLSTMNGRMGAMHNELVTDHFANTLDYKNDKFKLPADIRIMLQTLIDSFDKILS